MVTELQPYLVYLLHVCVALYSLHSLLYGTTSRVNHVTGPIDYNTYKERGRVVD